MLRIRQPLLVSSFFFLFSIFSFPCIPFALPALFPFNFRTRRFSSLPTFVFHHTLMHPYSRSAWAHRHPFTLFFSFTFLLLLFCPCQCRQAASSATSARACVREVTSSPSARAHACSCGDSRSKPARVTRRELTNDHAQPLCQHLTLNHTTTICFHVRFFPLNALTDSARAGASGESGTNGKWTKGPARQFELHSIELVSNPAVAHRA